ncbi:MAG: TrmH family RNA methyltransferase [Mycobacteriales bacterium]
MPAAFGAAAARRLRTPAGRRAAGRFLVEGPTGIGAAAVVGGLVEVFATPDALARHRALLDGYPVTEVAVRTLAGLADTATPQGLVGVARLVAVPLTSLTLVHPRLVAVLAGVADPGNAGTLVRTADAAGADAVVFVEGGVDPHNAKCVRASAGSVFHLPVAIAADVGEAVSLLRAAGCRILAADPHADRDLDEAAGELGTPTAWVFGNEAHGLGATTRSLADGVLRVPVYGGAESLNVATAAALCLYASARELHGGELHGGERR